MEHHVIRVINNNQSKEDTMQAILVKDIKKGEFVRRKSDSKKTYQRGEYDRATKTYSLEDWDDASREIFVKASTLLYTGFTF